MTIHYIFVLNCGSSSIKFAIVDPQQEKMVIKGLAESLGTERAKLILHTDKKSEQRIASDYQQALHQIFDLLTELPPWQQVNAIGHRVVHGGEYFSESTILDDNVVAKIEACNQLAPLHNPVNLLGIHTARQRFTNLPNVAVFDTAFHQTMPKKAYLYALPYSLYEKHSIRRYGFHGTSHRYVSLKAATILQQPIEQLALLTAHLGNGCSATAVLHGQSIDCTMGFTPLEGLVMGTRCGNIDPSLALHLQNLGYSVDEINELYNKKSGLLGISGISMDMRQLTQAAEKGNERAALAIDIFCYQLAKQLAGLAVSLGRVDALIFTGGIGENAALVRANTIKQLALLGFQLDQYANQLHGRDNNACITQPDSTIALVIPTNEELMIAQDTHALCF